VQRDHKRLPNTPDAPDVQSTPKGSISETILDAGARLEGRLSSQGHVRIEGTVAGDVSARGRVSVTEQASVEGDVVGDVVTVAGYVRGNIIARGVAVLRTGRVLGALRLERLATEEGCFLQGNTTMEERVDIAAAIEEQADAKLMAQPVEDEAEEEAGPDLDEDTLRLWSHRTYRPK
jgi:cytoskeletal protein CcmA (bactofilin family)